MYSIALNVYWNMIHFTRYNFDLWPGSAHNLHYLFQQDVSRLWDAFRKQMPGSSEVGLINALCDLSTVNQRVSVFL